MGKACSKQKNTKPSSELPAGKLLTAAGSDSPNKSKSLKSVSFAEPI